MTARMEPLPPKKWPAEMREALKAVAPTDARHSLTAEGRPGGANILGALAHHPTLAKSYFTLNAHLLLTTSLTERQRELVIMRAAALSRSSYEWAQHLFMARDAGLSDIEIGWVAWGPDAPVWNEGDACLLRAVDELVGNGVIGDETWAVLSEQLNSQEILDVIFTAGSYTMLAWMLSSLGVELDDDLRAALAEMGQPAGLAVG